MNNSLMDAMAQEFPLTIAKALTEPEGVDVAIKVTLNELIFQHARPTVTIAEVERAACVAFNAIWPLCDRVAESQSTTSEEAGDGE